MEEIITVDGRQFKLTTDRPLTAEQKAQTIAEIRKQTGCGTCGTRVANMGNDWGYGGIRTLATCTRTSIKGGDVVGLQSNPDTGTAPYTVKFFKQTNAAPTLISTHAVAADGGTASTSYTATDLDITEGGATFAAIANFDGSGITLAAKTANTVRFTTHVADSCPTGVLHCVDSCDIAIVCPTPTCNFVVT